MTGLTINDFELLEDGKPQAIDRARVHRAPGMDARWPTGATPTRSATASRWRADPKYRVFVLYLDAWHVDFAGGHRVARADQRPAQPDDGAAGPVRGDDAVPRHQGPAARAVDAVDSGAAGEVPVLGHRQQEPAARRSWSSTLPAPRRSFRSGGSTRSMRISKRWSIGSACCATSARTSSSSPTRCPHRNRSSAPSPRTPTRERAHRRKSAPAPPAS